MLGILYLKSVVDYNQSVRETTFEDTNISDIPDGVYVGKYDVDFIHAEVEIIADKIVDEQKIDVDAISGATNSSVGIKKAVENRNIAFRPDVAEAGEQYPALHAEKAIIQHFAATD